MDNRKIVLALNDLSKEIEENILKQVLALLIVGFFVEISDEICEEIFFFLQNIEDFPPDKDLSQENFRNNVEIILKLEQLSKKAYNEKTKLCLNALISSIAFRQLSSFRKILVKSDYLLDMYFFENDIQTEGRIIH